MVGMNASSHVDDGTTATSSLPHAPAPVVPMNSAQYFTPKDEIVSPSSSDVLHIDIPRLPMAAEIAFGALSTPLLVLSSLKTILLANAAAARLLDIDDVEGSVTDALRGQTLSQIGIDMVSDGTPIWVSWEKFLDNVAAGLQDPSENAVSGE